MNHIYSIFQIFVLIFIFHSISVFLIYLFLTGRCWNSFRLFRLLRAAWSCHPFNHLRTRVLVIFLPALPLVLPLELNRVLYDLATVTSLGISCRTDVSGVSKKNFSFSVMRRLWVPPRLWSFKPLLPLLFLSHLKR